VDLQEQHFFAMLKEGHESAFEMLFKKFYQPLCSYAYSFLNDKEEAEEIVQSTFITVWDKRNTLEIQSSFKAYLYRMVRNACLNAIKHDKVKQQHTALQMAAGEPTYENVAQHVLANELEQRIEGALRVLPEQCRLIFQLSRFEELKYAEIAEQLDISVKTVENQMGKALKILRDQLKEYLPLLAVLFNHWVK